MILVVRTVSALMLVAASSIALAQDSSQQQTAASSGAIDADTDQIIVTGEKIRRSLQDTPASVAVTTGDAIANQNLNNLYDILERTPNLSIDGNRASFSIRGIDVLDVSGGGDGPLASIYLDGAVLPRTVLAAGPLDLYDVAQVEVFRGPQSTVQGRNALAGAIVMRTTDPGDDWSGRARLMMTDQTGERRFAAALGGPIVDRQVAFRVAGEVSRSDGLLLNRTLNQDGDRRRSETLRGKLRITPDAIPGLRILGTYAHDRHRRGGFYSEFDAPFDPRERVQTQDVADRQTVKSDIGTLDIGYDLSNGLSVSAITSYGDVRLRSIADLDRGPTPGQMIKGFSPDKAFQQELRLNVDRDWVQGLVGAYFLRKDDRGYFFEATQNLGLRQLGVDRALLALGLPPAIVNAVLNLYNGGAVPIKNSLSQPRLIKNYAGFADFTFPLTDRLKLHAGLRYDYESQLRGATQVVTLNGSLPDPAALPIPLAPIVAQLNASLLQMAADANSTEPEHKVTYHAWLPKAGLTYAMADDISLSLTAQRGYRAGGAGLNQQRAQTYEYGPEYTWNYELALRSQWFDRRLTVNANAYWIDWTDQQVSVQLTPGAVFDTQTINAGTSRLYGAELEVSGRLQWLSLYGGLGYSNTKFRDFDVTVGQLLGAATGNEFANAPHWTLSGGATLRHPNGLFADINAHYRSAFYQDALIQMGRDIHGRTLVNTKLGWQGEHFGAFLIMTNIFDVQKAAARYLDSDGRTRGILTEPRVIGLSFEGRF